MSDHNEDDELSPEELAEAEALAAKVDNLVAGRPMATLGDPQEQELLRTSAMIRAAHHEVALDASRQSSIIEEALRAAMPAASQTEALGNIHSLDAARAKRRRNWSVAITGLVAAAAIALFLRRPTSPENDGNAPVATLEKLPETQLSRPADALVGQIAPEQSGMSSTRLDQIYGDRMGGYRALHFRRLAGKQ